MSSIVITSLGEERPGRCAGRILVCQRFVVSHFGTREGLRTQIYFHCFFCSVLLTRYSTDLFLSTFKLYVSAVSISEYI